MTGVEGGAGTAGASLADAASSDLSPRARTLLVSVRAMGLVALVAFGGVLWLFTRTARGQTWDERARYSTGASARAWVVIVDPLVYITTVSVAVVLAAFVVLALLRRRVGLAVAALTIVGGANVTTQLFKAYWPTHPHYWGNSLPSGHSTVAMSVSLAALVVAPSGLRRFLLPVAGFAATFVGAGTIVGHWHRPADVIAAFLVCLAWSALAIGLVLKVQLRRRTRDARYAMRPAWGLAGSTAAGLVFVLLGVHPVDHDVKLLEAFVALTSIGVLAAVVVAWVSAAADDNLG